MIKTLNEFDDNDKQNRHERPVIKIIRKSSGDDPVQDYWKQYAYQWMLAPRPRQDKKFRICN
ncbi:MAG: hypothetical protein HY746_07655 [Elusimicrobia bacterium]|nr:hypothetical protein [Elusimicrobiota bacterium]